jgi:uncharacterized membrane protein YqjE
MNTTEQAHPYELGAQPMQNLSQRALTELFSLIRADLQLARVELETKTLAAFRAGRSIVWATSFFVLALMALSAAVLAGLATLVPLWLSALIVAAVYAGAGGALVLHGRTIVEKAGGLAPTRSLEQLWGASGSSPATLAEAGEREESARQNLDRTVAALSNRNSGSSPMRDTILSGVGMTLGVVLQSRKSSR